MRNRKRGNRLIHRPTPRLRRLGLVRVVVSVTMLMFLGSAYALLSLRPSAVGPPSTVAVVPTRVARPAFYPTMKARRQRRQHHRAVVMTRLLAEASDGEEPSSDDDDSTSTTTTTTAPPYRIPHETIQAIKSMADIVTVVEAHQVPMFTRLGSDRAKALCPFHDDTNPSLTLDNTRQLYKCFSCGAGGDVFGFVREYRHIRDGGEKMSFLKSVRVVSEEYTDGRHDGVFQNAYTNNRILTADQIAALEAREHKKKRILLANAAAADFYGKCLRTLPAAGLARRHLQSRGIDPVTVRKFALGYAPDAYFSHHTRKKGQQPRGAGSLSYALRDLGFTAQEIVDAGLASVMVRHRRGRSSTKNNKKDVTLDDVVVSLASKDGDDGNNSSSSSSSSSVNGTVSSDSNVTASNSEEETEEDVHDFTTIMDRFRGRLMVPIFSKDGTNVIAFGGRHLEAPTTKKDNINNNISSTSSSFQAARYLNSAESMVFSKKNVLFGLHHAVTSHKPKDDGPVDLLLRDNAQTDRNRFVVVEGYFDALALSDVGVTGVTACMGTALSTEQLELLTSVPGMRGKGEINICLDGDKAGLNAVERLCASSTFAKLSEDHGVKVRISSIPSIHGSDPAEFIESMGGGVKAGKAFQTDVLEKAKHWSDWYVDRILSYYDETVTESGTQGSFSNVCDRVSDFLSTFPNAADRTRRAFAVAETLSDLLSPGSGSSKGLRIQLESDLLDMASRKANAREALSRRIEQVDGSVGADNKNTLSRLASGLGTQQDADGEDDWKQGMARTGRLLTGSQDTDRNVTTPGKFERSQSRRGARGNGQGKKLAKKSAPSLVPHIAGLDFENPSDAVWLGLDPDKAKRKESDMVFGTDTYDLGPRKKGKSQSKKGGKIVYFNSNEYLGYDGKSQSKGEVQEYFLDLSDSILQLDTTRIILQAEERLLSTLVQFASARLAMKAAVDANIMSYTPGSSDSDKLIEWSSNDRDWLFSQLIDSSDDEPLPSELQEGGTPKQLRNYLAGKSNAPVEYFGNTSESTDTTNEEVSTAAGGSRPFQDFGDIFDADPFGSSVDVTQDDDKVHAGGEDVYDYVPTDPDDIDNFAASFDPSMYNMDGNLEGDMNEHQQVDGLNSDLLAASELLPDKETDSTAKVESISVTKGSLDRFFVVEDDGFRDDLNRELRAELTVQETLAVILRASAIRRQTEVKHEWLAAYQTLLDREAGEAKKNNNGGAKNDDHLEYAEEVRHNHDPAGRYEDHFISMDDEDLKSLCDNLGNELKDLTEAVVELDNSARRMSVRLLSFTSLQTREFSTSVLKQQELAEMLDDHLANLPRSARRPEQPGDDGTYEFGSDNLNEQYNPKLGGRREPQAQEISTSLSPLPDENSF